MTKEEMIEAAERTCCTLWRDPLEVKWYWERTACALHGAAIFIFYFEDSEEAHELLRFARDLAQWRAGMCP